MTTSANNFIAVLSELLQRDTSKLDEVIKKVSEVIPSENIMQVAMNMRAKSQQVQTESQKEQESNKPTEEEEEKEGIKVAMRIVADYIIKRQMPKSVNEVLESLRFHSDWRVIDFSQWLLTMRYISDVYAEKYLQDTANKYINANEKYLFYFEYLLYAKDEDIDVLRDEKAMHLFALAKRAISLNKEPDLCLFAIKGKKPRKYIIAKV